MSGHDDYDNHQRIWICKESSCPNSQMENICVFKDADDEMRPKRIEAQLREAMKSENVECVSWLSIHS